MRLHPGPLLAVLALCMASPACFAAAGDTPASSAPAAAGASPTSASSAHKTGTRRHWRHWSHSRNRRRGDTTDFSAGGDATSSRRRGGRSGHGHTMRWHTVRDRHGNRHKVWYYADTGEAAANPDGDAEPARDLDAPLSRRDAADLHARRLKALSHLAAVEERVEHDRRQRAIQAKARLHKALGKDATKAQAAKK